MLYKTRIVLEWTNADGTPANYVVQHGVQAVSQKHALAKALKHMNTLPGYVDRLNADITIRGTVEVLGGNS